MNKTTVKMPAPVCNGTRKIISVMLLALFCAALFFVNPRGAAPHTREEFALNTYTRVTIYNGDKAALDGAFRIIREHEMIFSRTSGGSELSALNASDSNEWTAVSRDLYSVIMTAIEFCDISGGLFDITTTPLTDVWDFANGGRVPSREEISAALGFTDFSLIELKETDGAFFIKTNGAKIDLGAAAKGYTADVLARFLRENGVKSAIIDLGGNIYALGKKNKDTDFSVGILVPFSENKLAGLTRVNDKAVVTSGVYQRYFELDGSLYHHILDPKTGFPSKNGLYSATVICSSALEADILSTVLMLLPQTEGAALIESLPETEAVFITDNNVVITSSGVFLENIPDL